MNQTQYSISSRTAGLKKSIGKSSGGFREMHLNTP
jgi:hypothetical protein